MKMARKQTENGMNNPDRWQPINNQYRRPKKKKNLKHATPTRIKKHKRKQEWRETTGKNKENK